MGALPFLAGGSPRPRTPARAAAAPTTGARQRARPSDPGSATSPRALKSRDGSMPGRPRRAPMRSRREAPPIWRPEWVNPAVTEAFAVAIVVPPGPPPDCAAFCAQLALRYRRSARDIECLDRSDRASMILRALSVGPDASRVLRTGDASW